MAVDFWEHPAPTDEAEQEYRLLNPDFVRCILAEFAERDFWGKLEIIRQAAHDDPACSYRTPENFRPLTHELVASQHAALNAVPHRAEGAS